MGESFKFSWKGLEELQKDIRICAKEAIPYACRDALNDAAFEGRKIWHANMDRQFTTRNKYTERGVVVEKAKLGPIDSMQATIGSMRPYMGLQEYGGSEKKSSGDHHPVPTHAASGEPESSAPRAKQVRPRFRRAKIQAITARGTAGRTREQRNAIALSKASRGSGSRFVMFETEDGNELAVVTGRKNLTIKTLWDMSKTSNEVKPRPTLKPTMDQLEREMPERLAQSIIKQMRRRRILGY